MRIVLDLQACQSASRFGVNGRLSLSLALAMVRNAGEHEVWLVMNGAFPERVMDIRKAFEGLVPRERIRVFDIPTPVAEQNPANASRTRVAELIREQFFLQLKPDVIFVPSLFEGYVDDAVISVGTFASGKNTVVFINEVTALFDNDNNGIASDKQDFIRRKIQSLKKAGLIFTMSDDDREILVDKLRVPDTMIKNLCNSVSFGGNSVKRVDDLGDEFFNEASSRALTEFIKLNEGIEKSEIVSTSIAEKSRPRLAYVSPLPPERSGISDYSAQLLPELAHYYDIDVIVDQECISDPWIMANCSIHDLEWFKVHSDHYDRVLYHFGNSHFHQHMFDLLEEVAGVVVLHDFFLSHAIASLDASGDRLGVWPEALYHSHGYAAVQQYARAKDTNGIVWRYPCNLRVLQRALGIIIHSDNSRQLAKQWYGDCAAEDWALIPLVRSTVTDIERVIARRNLKIADNEFVVCTYGLLGPSKLNHRLLDAWFVSALAQDKNCVLLFVGENDGGAYGEKLEQTIKNSQFRDRIRITGWVDATTFGQYLAAADIAVQLRTLSRGETSAAVLDCMNYGLPTIVNANGSMADLPGDAVLKLPDDFDNTDLVHALEILWRDSETRSRLTKRAQNIINTKHRPGFVAEQYYKTLECFYGPSGTNSHALLNAIASIDNLFMDNTCLKQVAEVIATNNQPKPFPRQSLLDVTSLLLENKSSELQEYIRINTVDASNSSSGGLRVEPVYIESNNGRFHYRYARTFTLKALGIQQFSLLNSCLEFTEKDELKVLDCPRDIEEEYRFFTAVSRMRAKGLTIDMPCPEGNASDYASTHSCGIGETLKTSILVLGNYPVVAPRHGGQVRLSNIIKTYKNAGWIVNNIAVYEYNSYPPDQVGAFDIAFPQDSKFRDSFGEHGRFVNDMLIGKFASSDDGGFPDIIKRLPKRIDAIHIEQPWLWSLAKKIKGLPRYNGCRLIYGSQNIEAPLIGDIVKGYVINGADRIIDAIETIERQAACEADLSIAVTRSDKYVLNGYGAKRTMLAPNGIAPWNADLGTLDHWRKRLPKAPWILYVASAWPPNFSGFKELVGESLGCIPPNSGLVVAGSVSEHIGHILLSGPLASLNRTRLHLLGTLSDEDLAAVKTLAHAFLLPIPHGGGSNIKTAEALFSGSYVIGSTSAFRGFEEFIGLPEVTVAKDNLEFQVAIRDVLKRPRATSMMSDEGRKCRETLKWDNCLKQIPLVLDEIFNEKKSND